jgi:hypothetical protein
MEQASRLLMITPARIGQLQKNGYIPRGSRGHVPLVGAVQGYINFLKDEERRTSKSAAASRVTDARAKEIELRNQVRLRELIPVEDATAALDLVVGRVREEMNGLAARVTRDIPLRRKIEAEVNEAQKRIAESLGASAAFVEKGGELPYSDTPDDP